MQGKTILVTGSSRGIGFYTALGLAKKGAHVIILSHNREHCQKAVEKINAVVGKETARFYVADLSSQQEIRRFVDEIKTDYTSLDVLVNNVGGWFTKYQESLDGIELTFALNHLSYFLISGMLLKLLKEGAPARIINVSSDAHRQVKGIQFEDIQYHKKYKAFSAYAQSKLANILFTYALSARLEGSGVTVNALHPGFVATKLYRDYGVMTPLIKFLARVIGKTPEEGAQTSIYLASVPELDDETGKYFVDQEAQPSSSSSYDSASAKRLWEVSEALTGFTYPD